MAPHEYGQYLHILTRAGSDDSHDGQQPWEGITGRVKQETNRLEAKLKEATKGMEAKLEAQLGDMQSKLESQQSKLESKLDSQQSKLESIEALLTSLVAEKQ